MTTQMEKETFESPEVVHRLLEHNREIMLEIAGRIQQSKPTFSATIARGSSDHAATFAKYAIETNLGLITASFAPSVHTIYDAKPNFENALVFAISQSGESPDIIESLHFARTQGAITIALVNNTNSPLANTAEYVIPMQAGEEKAVAATKSFIASIANLILFTALTSKDKALLTALESIPDKLYESLNMDWQACLEAYIQFSDTLTIGRGFSFSMAQEAALKFKETCGIHAESFSGAEVLHGPYALIKPDYPVLMFCQNDDSLASLIALAEQAKHQQAVAMLAIPESVKLEKSIRRLPIPEFIHPMCDPLMSITAFYTMAAKLSIARGYNPDQPDNLSKVTKTR